MKLYLLVFFFVTLTLGQNFRNCTQCASETVICLQDTPCREGLLCSMNCGVKYANDPMKLGPCEFGCQLLYTQGDDTFLTLLNCMIETGCLAKMPDNGECRLNNTDGLKNITTMDQIEGDWWVVRGVNNQIDTIPCQMNRIQHKPDDSWVANCTLNDTLVSPPIEVRTTPLVKMDPPGTMTAIYDVGTHQIEYWTIISYPHPDWIFMLWCGFNDVIDYAGGIIQTRAPNKQYDNIPPWVEQLFREAAAKYGLEYDLATYVTPLDQCLYHP